MSDYASLCFLSFDRPKALMRAIETGLENAGYPCEVIVHDDGSRQGVQEQLVWSLGDTVSCLVLNPPRHNEGVGRAINRSFAMATGDPVVKIDQDLTFRPGWLRTVVNWLESDTSLGMMGLFKYEHDPVDWRKMRLGSGDAGAYHYCRDFVGSAMAIPRVVLNEFGPFQEHSDAFAEDVAYKERLRESGYRLAIPDTDLATNHGFGVGPDRSTIVKSEESGEVTKIQHGPVLL